MSWWLNVTTYSIPDNMASLLTSRAPPSKLNFVIAYPYPWIKTFDVIHFDFAKAFDSIKHDLILSKLSNLYNINGQLLLLLSNYLCGRFQSVVVNGCISDRLPVLSGVPQGSILGPSLFVLFINDISSGLNPGTNIMLYADDTKIWREMLVEEDYVILQRDIDHLLDWAIRNKMKFHPSKCKVLSISTFRPPLVDVLPGIQ